MIEDISSQEVTRFIDFDLETGCELLEIGELASVVTDSPYALISFTDNEAQFLKVRKGFNHIPIPMELRFCTLGLQQNSLLVVPDMLNDERFKHHPFVTGAGSIRFFAIMPLLSRDGENIGSLCVFDFNRHILNGHQEMVLKILANQVVKIMELRAGKQLLKKNQKELEEQKALNNDANIRLRSFFESSTNFQVLLGKHGEVIDFNKTAYNFIKAVHSAELKRGDQFVKYIHPEFVSTFISQYNLALKGQKSAKEGSTDYGEMGMIWWEAAFEAARDKNNEIIGISYLIRNVSERKLKEQKILTQNQSLLKIAHIQAHEFRGPLTTIMGLMGLIKEENYDAPSEYIQLLEHAVDTLDTTIRHIVSNIDETVIVDYASALQQ